MASEATLGDDGAVHVRWPAAENRPFELSVVYRWSSPSALDVVTTVSARADLAAFESFLASYFDEQFATSMIYAAKRRKPDFVEADDDDGAWQMFPRDAAAVKAIEDGRWTSAPNPVK